MRVANDDGFIALEGAKELFALYVTRVPTYQLIYGALSALPVFLLWVYFGWIIVLRNTALKDHPGRGIIIPEYTAPPGYDLLTDAVLLNRVDRASAS